MKPIKKTLVEQMKIHEAELYRRKELMGFSEHEADLLKGCKPVVHRRVDEIIKKLHTRLTFFDEIALLIGDAETLHRLAVAQKDYILELFAGSYGLDYVNKRLRVGKLHKRIGVEPKYYLSAVKTLKDILEQVLCQSIQDEEEQRNVLDALDKILYFDKELVLESYIQSMVSAVEMAKHAVDHYSQTLEEKVAKKEHELEELVRRDGLTSLYNLRTFRDYLKRDLSYAKRNGFPITLVRFDVDAFKEINDAEGHLYGDEILQSIGQVLRDICRDIDVPCRYGGDEFCVVLSGCTCTNAERFCTRLKRGFIELHGAVSLSMGVVQTGPHEFMDCEMMLHEAGDAMHRAKRKLGFYVEIVPPKGQNYEGTKEMMVSPKGSRGRRRDISPSP